MAEKFHIDPDELTIGDLEDFESETGLDVSQVLAPQPVYDRKGNKELDEKGRPVKAIQIPFAAVKVLVWIAKRRDDPEYTLDMARSVKVSEMVIGDDDDDSADGQGNDESADTTG